MSAPMAPTPTPQQLSANPATMPALNVPPSLSALTVILPPTGISTVAPASPVLAIMTIIPIQQMHFHALLLYLIAIPAQILASVFCAKIYTMLIFLVIVVSVVILCVSSVA